MKKLGKLKLHSAVIMSDSELKNVLGGMVTTPEPGEEGTSTDHFCKAMDDTCEATISGQTVTGKCKWSNNIPTPNGTTSGWICEIYHA